MATPVLILDTENGKGKEFNDRLQKLRKKIFKPIKGEKHREFIQLDKHQMEANMWLLQILENVAAQAKNVFDHMRIRQISMGNYARRGGSTFPAISEEYFRIFLHIGHPELYYLDNDDVEDEMVPLQNGYGFIIPSIGSTHTSVTVYPDPIRVINDERIQQFIPKIRPRKYERTTIIYDFQLLDSFFETDETKENDQE